MTAGLVCLMALAACELEPEGPDSFVAGGVVFTGVDEPEDRNHGRSRHNDRRDGVEIGDD
ncbi:hypothetical protein AADZ90_012525 [Aestuariibius sp. 2305UL40-4]|uniref:hypothetical protein n=1 Tax=Aestuariibius violaceus TaxID=3234132 RepID=UPI00345E9A60